MDKYLKRFLNISMGIFILFFIIISVFVFFYRHFTLNTYSYIFLVIIILITITLIMFILSGIAVFFTYEGKRIGVVFTLLNKIALKMLLPFSLFVSGIFDIGIFKGNKDDIRKIYIEINNILVNGNKKKYLPKEVLILLPHCLQNSECEYKVTNSIDNCHRCGKCCLGDISKLAQEKGISAVVVSGGTIARKIVSEYNPKLVLSVACERDLTSGIAEIGDIPAVGIINERPNGPCINTFIDVNTIKDAIERFI